MTENMVTIKSDNGEFTLEGWQVEAAYRHQLHKYTVMDAKEHVLDYQDTYHYEFLVSEHGKTPIKATEEDYENLADEFLNQYTCDNDDNSAWVDVIEAYFDLFQ